MGADPILQEQRRNSVRIFFLEREKGGRERVIPTIEKGGSCKEASQRCLCVGEGE